MDISGEISASADIGPRLTNGALRALKRVYPRRFRGVQSRRKRPGCSIFDCSAPQFAPRISSRNGLDALAAAQRSECARDGLRVTLQFLIAQRSLRGLKNDAG